MSAPAASPPSTRRHDLDWLRVIAVTLVVFFHAAMPYVAEWGWHIKNAETSHVLLEMNFFLSRWRMPLLFLVAGVGTSYALGDRPASRYLRDRVRRLLVPLLFGMLVIVPPQIYVERLGQGARYASFLEFWPRVLDLRPYPAGDTSWHHLWFIAYLLVYAVVLLPLFAWLRGPRRRRVEAAAERLVARVGLRALALPLALPLAALHPIFPGPEDIVHDWARLLYYMTYVLYGYLLARSEALWARIEAERARAVRGAAVGWLAVNAIRWNGLDPDSAYTLAHTAYVALTTFAAWCTILAILGFARRHLNRPSPALRYLNEGIYPVYVLHQTVIVVLAFYVTPLHEGIFGEFAFLGVVSLAVTWGLYETLVRPYPVARFLFGMKPAPRPAARATAPAPAAPPAIVGVPTPVPAAWGAE